MKFKLYALIGGGALFLGVVALLTWLNAQGVPPEELARRCEASSPQWKSYQEDIKGQVGAAPVAQWHGEPVYVHQKGNTVEVAFQIMPPWGTSVAAIPVMLRDPLGHEYISGQAKRKDGLRWYHFSLESPHMSILPWVEIHYPHQERRVALDSDGSWRSDTTAEPAL